VNRRISQRARLSSRFLGGLCMSLCCLVGPACSREPGAPARPEAAREEPAPPAVQAERAEPQAPGAGVKDFVEYATGRTQVETMLRTKAKLKELEEEHTKRLEEAMGE